LSCGARVRRRRISVHGISVHATSFMSERRCFDMISLDLVAVFPARCESADLLPRGDWSHAATLSRARGLHRNHHVSDSLTQSVGDSLELAVVIEIREPVVCRARGLRVIESRTLCFLVAVIYRSLVCISMWRVKISESVILPSSCAYRCGQKITQRRARIRLFGSRDHPRHICSTSLECDRYRRATQTESRSASRGARALDLDIWCRLMRSHSVVWPHRARPI
jgi:hypothetical protein